MTINPPKSLIDTFHAVIFQLLSRNPAATESESFVQQHLEFSLINLPINPRYTLRIGINYHGQKVQHISVDPNSGVLIGWNENGDALGIGGNAKVLLAGHTIFDRDPDEPVMNDLKIGGGDIPPGNYIRIEFKVRGWLGRTKNLAGKQLEKDIDLLKNDLADLLVICLSETAHRKWRGEGPAHHAARRTGTHRFVHILLPCEEVPDTGVVEKEVQFENQDWVISCQRVTGTRRSIMPGADHYVSLCWRK